MDGSQRILEFRLFIMDYTLSMRGGNNEYKKNIKSETGVVRDGERWGYVVTRLGGLTVRFTILY